MSSIIKLDNTIVLNRLGWRAEVPLAGAFPRWVHGYKGIYANGDFASVESELVVNKRLALQLDCSIAPHLSTSGSISYFAMIAPNPKLYEVATVSAPGLILPGTERMRPTLYLTGLKKFDLSELDWIASIHLFD